MATVEGGAGARERGAGRGRVRRWASGFAAGVGGSVRDGARWARRHAVLLALGLILAGALAVRGAAVRWNSPYFHHWDEPFVANRALQILRSGDFNPQFFNYGSLLIYLNAAVDALHYYQLVALPDDDPNHLRTPQQIGFRGAREDDLMTDAAKAPYWVSHPSFYLWNRRLTALFGTAAVALVFLLARRLGGHLAGLVAAFALAGNAFHLEQSVFITTDVPAATLALAALLAALVFAQGAPAAALVAAFALVGLATGAKYNAALLLVVPLVLLALATVRDWPNYRRWLWLAAPAALAGSFLLTTPYALFDLPTFLHHSGRMLSGYVARTGTALSVEPGWPHLALDLELFVASWGPLAAAAIAVGLPLALRRRAAWVVLPIGLAVFLATSRTMAPFHRNLVVCYPLAAVVLGLLARDLTAGGRARALRLAAAALVGLALWQSTAMGLARGRDLAERRDSRSRLVDRLNEAKAKGLTSVAIAAELGVHEVDLARLELPYSVAPLRDLICRPIAEEATVLPTRAGHSFEEFREEAARLARLLAGAGAPRYAMAAESPFAVDTPVVSPGLGLVYRRAEFVAPIACGESGLDLDALSQRGEVWRNPASLGLATRASVESEEFLAPAGRSLASIHLASADRERPALAVVEFVGRDGALLAALAVNLGRERTLHDLYLEVAAETPVRLRLRVAPHSPAAALLYGLWLAPAGE